MRRVVATGIGIVGPAGVGKNAFWASLLAGDAQAATAESAGTPTPRGDFRAEDWFESSADAWLAAEDRSVQLGVLALRLALRDARLEAPLPQPARAGTLFATSPAFPSAVVARESGLAGPCVTTDDDGRAGLDGIGSAFDRLRSGDADIMVVAATEESPRGAAAIVLEGLDRAVRRDNGVYAEIVSVASGASADERLIGDVTRALAHEGAAAAPDYVDVHGPSAPRLLEALGPQLARECARPASLHSGAELASASGALGRVVAAIGAIKLSVLPGIASAEEARTSHVDQALVLATGLAGSWSAVLLKSRPRRV